MGALKSIIKLIFGSKADKDRKAIMPYVEKIKAIYPSIEALSNDELRERSAALRKRIADFIAEDEAHVVAQKAKLEDINISLNDKEKVSKDIDQTVKRIDEKIEKYIVDIVFATRQPEAYGLDNMKPMIAFGGSPRASINLALAARAYAFIHRRGYVIPEDVRAVCYDVLRHRIGLTYEAEANNITTEDVITEVLNAVQVP